MQTAGGLFSTGHKTGYYADQHDSAGCRHGEISDNSRLFLLPVGFSQYPALMGTDCGLISVDTSGEAALDIAANVELVGWI